ncbi:MAG: outer membrane lipoprotein chaperone LolA [Gammaproteobacteria bacterium]|nr:outer membrane lipoprotein chaperone LolA [Gammaproteobacteria bacterium]
MQKKIFTFIFTLLFSSVIYAESAADTLTTLLLNINTMQASFSQVVKDKSAKSLQQSQGTIALQRPGKFRWDVKKPNPQLIIANGARIWIYDPDLQQVTIRAFTKSTGQTPAFLLSDKNLTLSKDFVVELAKNPSQIANQQIYLLTPKEKDSMFALIKLTFLNKQIRQMQLEDHLGHVTTVAFNNIKTGVTIPESVFTFTPSPKDDVIDETKK